MISPIDPNEKLVFSDTFIHSDETLSYAIHFENIAEDVEARDVFLTDQLDPDLDLSTVMVWLPGGSPVVLPADGSPMVLREIEKMRTVEVGGVIIEIPVTETWTATLDSAMRTVNWDLTNIDLEPGATDNVLLSVKPLPGLESGVEIRNRATIQFEVFDVIATNETVNVIDEAVPSCTVDPLPATTVPVFPVSWSGTDEVGEIRSYTLFVSEDGGPFREFFSETDEMDTLFEGEAGRNYGFLCIARDTAGNTEVQSPEAEAFMTTMVTNDRDSDGVDDPADNCAWYPNTGQADLDDDGVGDACDAQTCGNGEPEYYVGASLPGEGYGFDEECDDGNLLDGDGCSSSCELNRPPDAQCQDVTISADASCRGSASVDDGSTDPEGDAIAFDQTPSGPYDLGETDVTLTVTDELGAFDTCEATVTVVDNASPAMSCPDEKVVECAGPDGAAVSYTSPAPSDNCGIATTSCSPPSSAMFELGGTEVTCTATDHAGNASQCGFDVTVQDTVPPAVSVSVLPDVLWPPNHKLKDVAATVAASDLCDTNPNVKLISIDSTEPDNGMGDGDKPNDIQGASLGTYDREFSLRAERSGNGEGRRYTVTFSATDTSGNEAMASAQVTVPHDQGKGKE